MFKTIFGNSEVAEFNGKKWLKVFSHKFESQSDCFGTEEEALHCNKTNKYSILDTINDSMKINRKFEFIIEYPNENIYFHWKQSLNPLNEIEEEGRTSVKGFVPIHNGTDDTFWGGLTKSTLQYKNVTSTLIDGVPRSSYWRFSIGMYCNIEGWSSKDSMPGPNRKAYKQVRLWLRIKLIGEFISCNKPKLLLTNNYLLITLLLSN